MSINANNPTSLQHILRRRPKQATKTQNVNFENNGKIESREVASADFIKVSPQTKDYLLNGKNQVVISYQGKLYFPKTKPQASNLNTFISIKAENGTIQDRELGLQKMIQQSKVFVIKTEEQRLSDQEALGQQNPYTTEDRMHGDY